MKKILLVVLVVAFAVASASCASYYQAKRGEMGGLISSSCALNGFQTEKPGMRTNAAGPFCYYDAGIRYSINTNQIH
jgi:hypothetical protein